MRIIAKIAFLYFIFLSQLSAQNTSCFYHPFIDSLIQQVDTSRIFQHILNLSEANGFRSRVTFTPGNSWAANYIKNQLESYNRLTEVKFDTFLIPNVPFPFDTIPLMNVTATLNGNQPTSPYYIIGGHYDDSASLDQGIDWSTAWPTVQAQGADDNATGIAILLEIARILADPQNQFDNDISIKFVAFAAEESNPGINNLNHRGSYHYASTAFNQGEQIAGVYIIDMVGYTGTMYHHFNIVSNQSSVSLGEAILEANPLYQIDIHTNSSPFTYATYSDHDRFWVYGYKAILLIENAPPWNDNLPWYIKNPYYHTREDKPEHVNIPQVSKIAQSVLATIACLAAPHLSTIASSESVNLPQQIMLFPNYPNPFNATTTISYRLAVADKIEISVYNLQGEKVVELYYGWQPAGDYKINWEAQNEKNEPLPSSMYFLRLTTTRQVVTQKMILLK